MGSPRCQIYGWKMDRKDNRIETKGGQNKYKKSAGKLNWWCKANFWQLDKCSRGYVVTGDIVRSASREQWNNWIWWW